jgi:hypothetical protein
VKGTAAEAIRDDFTKPRREICRVMRLLLPIPKSNVKEQLAGPAHGNLNPAVSNPHPQLRYAKMPMES